MTPHLGSGCTRRMLVLLTLCLPVAWTDDVAAQLPEAENLEPNARRSEGVEPAVLEAATISPAVTDEQGLRVHAVSSATQSAATKIKVLLPSGAEETGTGTGTHTKFPVVYLLPVEAGEGKRWGDPLGEVRKAGLHERYGAICVYPTFADLPWYCDHPTNPEIRQETYLVDVVVPAVERHYPARRDASARWLVGFSKSGWGAWSLLLRHPDRFSRAVAWDAPVMMDEPGRYGSGPIFGDARNFRRYRLVDLLRRQREVLLERERLALLGYGNFRADHRQMHELLERIGVPHAYRDGPQQPHHWSGGWLPAAFDWVVAARASGETDAPAPRP